jgi:peroxiredoxin family protein
MLAVANRGGTGHLRLSKMNFLGAGPMMMRKLAKDHNVASPQELLEIARDLGVKLVPCQMTMDLMGLKREDLVEGVGEPAGAMSAIEDMKDAVTLFI